MSCAGCSLVLERDVAHVYDDFIRLRTLVSELGNRINLLSCSYHMQLALINELSSLKDITVDHMPTSVSDALVRQSECHKKVCY